MVEGSRKRIAIMTLDSLTARNVFDELIEYLFGTSPINSGLLNEKIYIYSKGEDKSIIGYIKIGEVFNGKTYRILKQVGYFKNDYSYEVIKKFGKYNHNCHAFKLNDVTEFDRYLPLIFMKQIDPDIAMPHFIKFIYDSNPLYYVIKEWDDAFSLDGKICKDSKKTSSSILKRGRDRVTPRVN